MRADARSGFAPNQKNSTAIDTSVLVSNTTVLMWLIRPSVTSSVTPANGTTRRNRSADSITAATLAIDTACPKALVRLALPMMPYDSGARLKSATATAATSRFPHVRTTIGYSRAPATISQTDTITRSSATWSVVSRAHGAANRYSPIA